MVTSVRQLQPSFSPPWQGSGAKALIYLGNQCLKKGKLRQAASYYQDVTKALVGSQPRWSTETWTEGKYIVNSHYGFIYCPIPKVACSSFKKIMVKLSQLDHKDEILALPNDLLHSFVYHNLSLAAMGDRPKALALLNQDTYFKFAFVRNPWDRLTSAYLNKIVLPENLEKSASPGKAVVRDVYEKRHQHPDYQTAITFREFVKYVSETEDDQLDGHWQPQHLFLGHTTFDMIGKFENLAEDFGRIQDALNLEISLPWSNRSSRQIEEKVDWSSDRNVADYYPAQLKALKRFPSYPAFYSNDLIERVSQRYQQDIEQFNYSFE